MAGWGLTSFLHHKVIPERTFTMGKDKDKDKKEDKKDKKKKKDKKDKK